MASEEWEAGERKPFHRQEGVSPEAEGRLAAAHRERLLKDSPPEGTI
jgi:hypothetical protein